MSMQILKKTTVALFVAALWTGCQSPPFLQSASETQNDFKNEEIPQLTEGGSNLSSSSASSLAQSSSQPNSKGHQGSGIRQVSGEAGFSSGSNAVLENLNRGHAQAQQGRLDQAKAHYQKVLQVQPQHPVAHHRLAVIADRQQDYRTAEQHYQVALRLSPQSADILSDLGYSYLLQKRYSESEQFLKKALKIDPEHQQALNNLGLLYGKQGNYEQALAIFRQAGTEAEAQAKIAHLFPQGPPKGSQNSPSSVPGSPASPASGFSSQQVGQNFSHSSPTNSPAGNLQAGSGPNQASTGNTPSPMTLKLKEMMEQKKRQARARRNGHQLADHTSSNSAPKWYDEQPSGNQQASFTAPEAGGASSQPKISSRQAVGNGVPSANHPTINPSRPVNEGNQSPAEAASTPSKQINLAFSEIDSQYRSDQNSTGQNATRQNTSGQNRFASPRINPRPAGPSSFGSSQDKFAGSGTLQDSRQGFSSSFNNGSRTSTSPQTEAATDQAGQKRPLDSMPLWPPTTENSTGNSPNSQSFSAEGNRFSGGGQTPGRNTVIRPSASSPGETSPRDAEISYTRSSVSDNRFSQKGASRRNGSASSAGEQKVPQWPHSSGQKQSVQTASSELSSYEQDRNGHSSGGVRQAEFQSPKQPSRSNQSQFSQNRKPAHGSSLEGEQSSQASRKLNEAERKAAMMGLNAGPGQMFPLTDGRAMAPRAFPGTGSQINGGDKQPAPGSLSPRQSSMGRNRPSSSNNRPLYGSQSSRSQPSGNFGMQQEGSRASSLGIRQSDYTQSASPSSDSASSQSDPLQQYEEQIRTHNQDYNALKRKLEAERQYPGGRDSIPNPNSNFRQFDGSSSQTSNPY